MAERVRPQARPDHSRGGRRHVPQHQSPDPDHPRGAKDIDHPKRTSLEVSCLIEGAKLIDPPWPEDAWEQAAKDRATGKADGSYYMFDTWVQAAPAILGFIGRP